MCFFHLSNSLDLTMLEASSQALKTRLEPLKVTGTKVRQGGRAVGGCGLGYQWVDVPMGIGYIIEIYRVQGI